MKPILFLAILILLPSALTAQLVSWQDLLNSFPPQPTERIYFSNDSLQFGDLWLPDNGISHTTVILVHGGCWLAMYPGVELMNHMAHELRKSGFAVWNLEYRRIGHEGGGYPGTFIDIAKGADYLHEIAATYRLNLDRIISSGHSAGGHLATWLAVRKNIVQSSMLYHPDPIPVHGVISLAGINDLARYQSYGASSCGRDTVAKLVDKEKRGESAYSDTSPVELLPLGIPFTEVIAAFDAPVPPFFGYYFNNSAINHGDHASLILQPNAGHF